MDSIGIAEILAFIGAMAGALSMWWQGTPRTVRLAHKYLEIAAELPDESKHRHVLVADAERTLSEHLEFRRVRQVIKDVLAILTLGAVTIVIARVASDQGGLWWATTIILGAVTGASVATGLWALHRHVGQKRQ